MNELLAVLATSDAGSADWYAMLTTDISHFAMGFGAAVAVWGWSSCYALVLVVFGVWVGKELFSDLLRAAFDLSVLLDSLKDLLLGIAGYLSCIALIGAVGRGRR